MSETKAQDDLQEEYEVAQALQMPSQPRFLLSPYRKIISRLVILTWRLISLTLVLITLTVVVDSVLHPRRLSLPSLSLQTFCAGFGIQYAPPCAPDVSWAPGMSAADWVQRVNFTRFMEIHAKLFNELAEANRGLPAFALDIRHVYAAIQDLADFSRSSNFAERDLIADAVHQLANDTETIFYDLSSFDSTVVASLQGIMLFSWHASTSLNDSSEALASSRVLSLVPWYRASKEVRGVFDAFDKLLRSSRSQVGRLLVATHTLRKHVIALGQQLESVAALADLERTSYPNEPEDPLERLWTRLGGKVADGRMLQLRKLGAYQSDLAGRILASLQALKTVQDEMEELLSQLADPTRLRMNYTAETHLRAIEEGLAGLHEVSLRVRFAAQNLGSNRLATEGEQRGKTSEDPTGR